MYCFSLASSFGTIYARLQLAKLVPASPNEDMANFLSFDVYDIDLVFWVVV